MPDTNKFIGQTRVCHVVTSINEGIGGPAISVPALAESLAEAGMFCHLLTLDYAHRGQQTSVKDSVHLHTYQGSPLIANLKGFSPQANRCLNNLASSGLDLIHNHGLWLFPNLYARQASVRNNLPLVISPRGSLEPWSLTQSRLRKKIVWKLYEKNNLKSASLFHATSEQEAKSIRAMGFQQPIAIIPNGVPLSVLSFSSGREVLEKSFPELKNKRWLLFLSRLHPKKGVDVLISVWKELNQLYRDWHLVIAGPDYGGYRASLEKLAADLGISDKLTFTDVLSGKLKVSALGNANLFVLPTHSENFGIAVAEALACGTPVVTTKAAPWSELVTTQSGWWIDDNKDALLNSLKEAMELSESNLSAMGQRGQKLVLEKYSWEAIAKDMASVYAWLLHGGNPPSCVLISK